MKNTGFLAVACSALLLSVFVGQVQSNAATAPAPTPVPYAMPDFSSMKFLMGTWTCRQTLRGKIRPDTSTATMGLDGMWMVTHDVAPPFDKYRTRTVVSDSYLTYNPISKLWATVTVDNHGGYFVSTSPGWRGNTLSTTTKLANDGSTGSDVLTKISDKQTSDAGASTDPKGHVTRFKVTCTKTG